MATQIEQAIITASINVLTRRADAIRAAAAKEDPGRAFVQRRFAAHLDACAFGLFDILPMTHAPEPRR